MNSDCALFADDTKIFAPVSGHSDRNTLQIDLDSLLDWTVAWQLPFNESKCKVIHYGKHNPHRMYTLGQNSVNSVVEEKDLGVTFDPSLNFSLHHDKAIAKANSRLGLVKRSFRHLDEKSFITLYKSLIRPILEYSSVVTNPVRKQDQDRLESVQRRATKLVPGLKDKPYGERLKVLKIPSLKYRRKRCDVLQTYRILTKVDDLEETDFFTMRQEDRTRSNGFKIFKRQCRTKARANAFSQRVVNNWNNLPKEVTTAPTVNRFKSALENHWQADPDKYLQ